MLQTIIFHFMLQKESPLRIMYYLITSTPGTTNVA